MRAFTTPILRIIVQDVDITGTEIYVTFAQYNTSVTVQPTKAEHVNGNTELEIDMTQVDTGKFKKGQVNVQLNWVDIKGRRNATVIKTMCVGDNLLKEVL